MKCEKQRHQGEENSSKPKMGTSAVSPYTPVSREHRAPHRQGRPSQGPQLISRRGFDEALIPFFAFLLSPHLPGAQHRTGPQSALSGAPINVLSGNHIA